MSERNGLNPVELR